MKHSKNGFLLYSVIKSRLWWCEFFILLFVSTSFFPPISSPYIHSCLPLPTHFFFLGSCHDYCIFVCFCFVSEVTAQGLRAVNVCWIVSAWQFSGSKLEHSLQFLSGQFQDIRSLRSPLLKC